MIPIINSDVIILETLDKQQEKKPNYVLNHNVCQCCCVLYVVLKIRHLNETAY